MRITSLDISEHKHAVLADSFESFLKFRTSLNIIGEVLNVPLCALKSILRQNGHSDVNPSDYCIDEKELEMFAEAYIRKMRCYFTSSIRNISTLSFEEKTDLNKFYNHFKKEECYHLSSANWNQIDTNKIRAAFMDIVKEKTENPFEIIGGLIFQNITVVKSQTLVELQDVRAKLYERLDKKHISFLSSKNKFDFLEHIVRSNNYIAPSFIRHLRTKSPWCINILRKLFISARYHINITDDAHHNYATY